MLIAAAGGWKGIPVQMQDFVKPISEAGAAGCSQHRQPDGLAGTSSSPSSQPGVLHFPLNFPPPVKRSLA